MDDVTNARMRWIESSIDLVRSAFSDGATEVQRREAAAVLRAAADMLDGRAASAANPPGAGPGPAQASPPSADPLDQLLAMLNQRLERDEQEQQHRNGQAASRPFDPYGGYGSVWPWGRR